MSTQYNSSVCFFPDGSTTGASQSPPFVPCNPELPVSACCPVGMSCLGNGLCLQTGGILRGGCTDQTWISAKCPNVCTDSNPSSKAYGNQDSYAWLQRCSFSVASSEFTWACGLASQCTDDDTFVVNVPNPTATDIAGTVMSEATSSTASQTQPISSCSILESTHTSQVVVTSTMVSPTSIASSGSNCSVAASGVGSVSSAAVGIAVGVPLLVLFLTALASTFWYRRKWKKLKRHSARSAQSGSSLGSHDVSHSPQPVAYKNQHELPYQSMAFYQLHEMNNRATIAEMSNG